MSPPVVAHTETFGNSAKARHCGMYNIMLAGEFLQKQHCDHTLDRQTRPTTGSYIRAIIHRQYAHSHMRVHS